MGHTNVSFHDSLARSVWCRSTTDAEGACVRIASFGQATGPPDALGFVTDLCSVTASDTQDELPVTMATLEH